ncbi:MAG: co-chaperone GroES [Candidatus Paceibacterota bacterium]|jgi:chaperonin GroES
MPKNKEKKGVIIRPLGDKVLVKTDKGSDQTKTKSGIIIPDTINKERPEEGVVVAVGEGKRLDNDQLVPLQVKKGDQIIFSKYGPDEIKINDEEYLIVSESNILAIID